MADYQIAYNPTTKVATIQALGDALPAGSGKIGEFDHDAETDQLGPDENHVFFHHVREALCKRKASNPAQIGFFPDNITDMAGIIIAQDVTYVALLSIEIGGNVALTVASPTHQIVVTPIPSGANNAATFVSANPAVATVNAAGLVTRVSNGTSVITVTSVDGGFTDTKTITCTA